MSEVAASRNTMEMATQKYYEKNEVVSEGLEMTSIINIHCCIQYKWPCSHVLNDTKKKLYRRNKWQVISNNNGRKRERKL